MVEVLLMRLGLVFLLLAAPLLARHDSGFCGTTRDTPAERLFLHRQAQRARAGRSAVLAPSAPAADRDIGHIAIIEDSGGVVEKLNQFTLDGSTLSFTPSAAGAARYRYAVSGAGYDSAAATQGTPIVALGDDDWRQLKLPFSFPFYGATYTTVFLNSDGNLTFVASESASSGRSTGRMTGGPPRIAPLFDDLDPSLAPGGVRYLAAADRAVFTWAGVPQYTDFGVGAPQTFQVRLYPDGRIQFAYNGVSPSSAVVGIAPGNLQGDTNLVSFLTDPSADYASAVVERFGNTLEIDVVTVAQRFYKTHEDAYDYLVIYNNMDIGAMPGAIAYESTVRSASTGHGVPAQDNGTAYGSTSRLRSVLNMGMLSNYAVNPDGPVLGREAARDTPLTVLGHEAGHLFNAFASVRDPDNPANKIMLGFGGSHWSFVFDSEASLDEGEQILDRGAGASPRFLTAAVTQGYAPLDQYLMGFRPSSDVPGTFAVTGSGLSPLGHPQSGISFSGARLDIGVNDVIAAEGRRTPDYTVAQRRYRFAFILVVPQGSSDAALDASVQQVETYRQLFPAAYSKYASGNASADATLNRSLKLSLFPAAGVLPGAQAAATLTVQTAPKTDLAVRLQAPAGNVQVPAAVTIRAGADAASFTITGIKSGVEELLAASADAAWETAYARVQVADASSAQLVLVSGGPSAPAATLVRLTDVNGLPYPGARLSAASAGGSVTPANAVTDVRGEASFHWSPAASGTTQLTISAEASPAVSLTLAAGSTVPAISAVVNAASSESGISPGSLVTLYGANLAGGRTDQATYPWPASLDGVTVMLGGAAMPLLYISDTQINLFVPAGMAPGPAVIRVITPSGAAPTAQVTVSDVQPGIFPGAILRAGTAISALTTPMRAGDFIEIYCTGLGPTRLVNGLAVTAFTPTVFLGGVPLVPAFSGLAPGFVGLYQVDVRVPAGLAAGPQGVILSSGNARSNEIQILVQ
jgi:uncharacterized protein (TIGR03437 family)